MSFLFRNIVIDSILLLTEVIKLIKTYIMEENKDYAVVKKCSSLNEANIIMALLKSSDIECFTSDTSFSNLFPSSVGTVELLEIRVRLEDEKKALDILNAKFDVNDIK